MNHVVKVDLDRLATITLYLALLWGGPLGVTPALGEYLWPPLPEALRIVEYQRSFYRLLLQKIVVCRTARVFPQTEPDFTEQVFDQNTRKKWLPLSAGCCSYKYRRHVSVVIAQQDQRGSLIVQAALIQSRRDLLRSNWTKINTSWL